jgi:hypothetical protein
MLKQIDSTISAVSNNPSGNRRQLEVNLNKGVLKFDGENDKISINILTKEAYSEPGVEITNGEVKMNTTKVGSNYDVALYKIYSENKTVVVSEVVGGVLTEVTKIIKAGKNITLDGTEESKSVTKSATVKEIFITNNGYQNNMTIVNIQIQ